MKRWIPYLLYAGIFFLLLLPAFLHHEIQLLSGDDIRHFSYFYRQFFNQWLYKGVIAWWNPYAFGGVPFAANPITNMWYPVNWLYVLFPLPFAYIYFLWFHLVLGASGMYILLRFILPKNNSFIPAFSGGLVFSLSGFMSARIFAGHIEIIATASYMPLIMYLFFRIATIGTWRSVGIAGIALGLQLSSGYLTLSFFTFILVGMLGLWFAICKRTVRHVIPFCLSIFCGFGLSAVLLFPTLEFLLSGIRIFSRTYAWASAGSVPFISFLLQLVRPFPYGKPFQYAGPPPNFHEHAFYFGGVPIGVICVGFICAFFKKKPLRYWMLFFVIFLFGIWMSMGNYAAVDLLKFFWNTVPFYKMLRIPTRHLIFVVFGASVLFGLGLSLVKHRIVQIILSVVIAIDLFFYAQTFIQTRELPEQEHDGALVAFFQQDKDLFRILPNYSCSIEPRSVLKFDEPAVNGIFSATGYDPTMYRPYYDFIDASNGSREPGFPNNDIQAPYVHPDSPAMNFLNIKYVLTPTYAEDPFHGKSTEQFVFLKEDAGRRYRVYENKNYAPRFFLVPTVTPFDTYANLVAAIREGTIDFRKTIGILAKDIWTGNGSPDCASVDEGKVDVLSYTPNEIILRVTTPCDAYISSSEIMYPGWEATIDGKKTKIVTGNMAFRTIPIAQGEHMIRLYFVPYMAYIGGGVSLVTFCVILFFLTRTIPNR